MLDHFKRAQTLTDAQQPFVIATVVRTEAPTSAKAGAKAIVTADGQLNGWVGGSCTQPTVVRESLKALADGQPRFLRMCPPDRMHGSEPGIVEVVLTCISGGTLEIYLEPYLPQPHLLAIGHLPVVEALSTLAKDMNYEVTVVGENATTAHFPRADKVMLFDASNWREQVRFDSQTYVVIASHGNYDELALEAALNSEASYIALVASHKRREAVLDYLRGSGLSDEKLKRLKCPAGLDIGAVSPEEIALSILAEIVQLRRKTTFRIESSELKVENPKPSNSQPETQLPQSILDMRLREIPTPGPGEALDPVCYMIVEIATARYKSDFEGQTYYFCAPGCKRSFEKNPKQFLVTSNQ